MPRARRATWSAATFGSPAAAAGSAWQRASRLKPRAMHALRGMEGVFSRRGGAFLCREDVGGATEDERRRNLCCRDTGQGSVLEVDVDLVPFVQPEGSCASGRAELEEALGLDHVSAERQSPGGPFDLTQLLEGIDAHIRVGADAERDPALDQGLERGEPVSEVCLRGRTQADERARLGQEIQLVLVGMRRVDDRRPRPETPALGKELDGPETVFGEALLDLARLLVRMDVQDDAFRGRIAAYFLQPVAWAGTDRVGGDTHGHAPA